ncbi:MAG: S8 family peptidase [Clostridiales bacterium]|nr:S8 family peptidase [Clostridiales bacterium]MCF8023614.1 S8 family peptidase [Clostridiales bacterium]
MADRPHLRISPESIVSRNTDFEGGGSTYRRNDYHAHGQSLINGLRSINQRLQTTRDVVKDRAFLEIKLAPGEKIKDRYENLKNNAQITVLDVINESTGYGVIKKDDMPYLDSRLCSYAETEEHTGKSYFSFVEELNNIDGLEKLSPRLRNLIEDTITGNIEVTIESFSNLPREALEFGFVEQCKNLLGDNGKINSSYIHTSGSVVVEVEANQEGITLLIQNFDSIRSMDVSPKIVLPMSQPHAEDIQTLNLKDIEGDAKVCIFDSGTVEGNQYFDPFIIDRINAINANGFNTFHGSFVASRVIFRENVEDQLATGELTPHVKILDIRVFGLDSSGKTIGLSESELINLIKQTVRDYYQEIKVYNLSLGFVDPVTDETSLSDFQVTRIAAQIDAISKEKDVLFIISAGNINSLYQKMTYAPYPNYFSDEATRILPPGESFLGITVGSVSTKTENGALGGLNHPSPFSRRGPGAFGTLKPEVVADGGNVTANGNPDQRLYSVALGENPGDLSYNVGTSFAAPLVSSYAAELFDKISDASANLVKGLLLHFSSHPNEMQTYGRDEKLEHIGFGVPNLNYCLESLKSKATYIYEGSVPQQTYVKIPFWVPPILANDTTRSDRKKLKLRVTLVWNPITDRRKREDYSLIHMNMNLFKIGDNGQEREVRIPLSQLLEPSFKMKFFPVVRMEKDFERSFSGGLWSIQLRMSSRWDVPEDYEQDFAILISVEDPQDTIDVYEEIINEVGIRYQPLLHVR